MKREVKKAWVAELRSGKLPQTTGHLHKVKAEYPSRKTGYCCLGVLCSVMGLEEETKSGIDGYEYHSSRFLFPDQHTSDSVMIPNGFAGVSANQARKLASMNDGDELGNNRKTFSEIADWIVKNIPVDKE